jgi:hypothetical protein
MATEPDIPALVSEARTLIDHANSIFDTLGRAGVEVQLDIRTMSLHQIGNGATVERIRLDAEFKQSL